MIEFKYALICTEIRLSTTFWKSVLCLCALLPQLILLFLVFLFRYRRDSWVTIFTICFLSSRGISYQFASINESFWFSDSAVRCWHRSTLSFFLIVIGWASYSIFISFLTDDMFSIALFFSRNLRCKLQHFPTFSSYGVHSSLRFSSFILLPSYLSDG